MLAVVECSDVALLQTFPIDQEVIVEHMKTQVQSS